MVLVKQQGNKRRGAAEVSAWAEQTIAKLADQLLTSNVASSAARRGIVRATMYSPEE
jgi:hypothetical protein